MSNNRPRKTLLQNYRQKRNFQRTTEPRGSKGKPASHKARFVVQKHAARSLHYDFRLEVDGVLKSWAVRKGPSTNPGEKRLAVATENHPLEYAGFEGTIPKGEYGGGTVLVWDKGTYRNLAAETAGKQVTMQNSLKNGHAKVWLNGKKLKGGYALIRFREKDQWLLVKMNDEEARTRRNLLASRPESVLTGRTLHQIASARAKNGTRQRSR